MAVPCHGAGSEAVGHLVAFPISLVGAAAGGLGPPVPTGLGKNNPGGWLGLHGSPRLPGTHTHACPGVCPAPRGKDTRVGTCTQGRALLCPPGVWVSCWWQGAGGTARCQASTPHPHPPVCRVPVPRVPLSFGSFCPRVLQSFGSICPHIPWSFCPHVPLSFRSFCPHVLLSFTPIHPRVPLSFGSICPLSPCPPVLPIHPSPRLHVPLSPSPVSSCPHIPVSPCPPSPFTCPVSPSTPHPLCLLAPHSRVPAPRGATPRGHLGVTSGHWGSLGVTGAVRSSRGASPPGGAVGWAAPLGAALRRGRPTLWYRASERTKWAWRGGAAAIPTRRLCSCRAPRPGTAEEEAEIPEIKPRGRSRRFG